MNNKQTKKEQILQSAQKVMHYNELLIAQCDSWLSEEEGMKNLEERIRERKRKASDND